MKMTTLERWTSVGDQRIHKKRIRDLHLYIEDQQYSLDNALNQTNYKLRQCGWYYPEMTRDMAKEVLLHKPIGCFLLRQSSDSTRNFTVSVKTSGGVVSIRIVATHRDNEMLFRLDCSKRLTDTVVEESCVVDLVQQLVDTKALDAYRFSDNRGRSNISLQLQKPVSTRPPSLKHLTRIALHKHASLTEHKSLQYDKLPIPDSLKEYLGEYTNTM